MTTTMNLETPVNGVNLNDVSEIINGIDNGICTVSCVTSTTSVDAAGDYRITRRLECVSNNEATVSDRILDLEIAGTQGTTPVVTLNGQVLPAASVVISSNGIIEIRNLKGMLIDRVQLPINATASLAGTVCQGLPYQGISPVFGGQVLGGTSACAPQGQFISSMNLPYAATTRLPFAGMNSFGAYGATKKTILGISVRPVSNELVHHVAVDARNVCVISDIVADSPAFTAGLEPNDLILSINGKQASLTTLRHELDAAKIGQVIRLVVLGKGVKREIDVILDGNYVANSSILPTQFPGYFNPAAKYGFGGRLGTACNTTSYCPTSFYGMSPMSGYGNHYGLGYGFDSVHAPIIGATNAFGTRANGLGYGYNTTPAFGIDAACCCPSMSSVYGTTAKVGSIL